MNKPLITIITPTYNCAKTLERTLLSVAGQSYRPIEHIILDNLSEDGTVEILAQYRAQFDHIRYYSCRDEGIYDAMNRGIHMSKGDWLYFLGGDDELSSPDILMELFREGYLSRNRVIYGNVRVEGDLPWARDGALYDGPFDLKKILAKNICHQAIIYPRRVFIDYGCFNTRYKVTADYDFNLRCWSHQEFEYTDKIIATFHSGGSSSEGVHDRLSIDFPYKVKQYFGLHAGDERLLDPESPFLDILPRYPGLDWNSLDEKIPDAGVMETGELLPDISATDLTDLLRSTGNRVIVAFSHDNYLVITGGVQNYMKKERIWFEERSIAYLQFHPATKERLSANPASFEVVACLNDRTIGKMSSTGFLLFGESLSRSTPVNPVGVLVHHTLNWPLTVLERFLGWMNGIPLVFWLHDYFLICRQVNLLRNDYEYCHKPGPDSNACMICRYGELRRENLPLFRSLVGKFPFEYLTPSEVSRAILAEEYPEIADKITISPLLRLVNPVPIQRERACHYTDPAYRIRIAFLGTPVRLKGWETWRKFADSPVADSYDCFQFSKDPAGVPESFVYVDSREGPERSAIHQLVQHAIDVVFLWSIVPETYSFTVHEARAAGCFIITNPRSGNIAFRVQQERCGVVLSSDEELMELLGRPDQLRELLVTHAGIIKVTAELEHNEPEICHPLLS
ncbi:MAG TPA: glycosyltransferase [Bacteroidales bacterium]|nr:glycosyltransferase [Bacteroidales bacterium]